uniref:Large ribosomal subunit protein uL30m n=1 Tax=Phallusia mammillata TaxID=59560 RepID=A0A6F9DFM3_9ASCI|nr:uncharacterized protein LOC100175065 [Phallusia mammillata]
MAHQFCRQLIRPFHMSAIRQTTGHKARSPVKSDSIAVTAAKLGFETPEEMYPVYPLDEPPKFWMITQIKPLKHRPYWEKEAMKEMGLHRVYDISVQINFPKVNEILWTVKHLITIKPVRFPQGLPTKEDIGYTQLHNDGRFVIYKRIEPQPTKEEDKIPTSGPEEYKVVDGFRMCTGCRHRRCLKFQMCQKLWMQRGYNYLESIGPKMFNFVDNPAKKLKSEAEKAKSDSTT